MNEANVDQDFEAAVIQLRQGQRNAALKFGAIMLLMLMLIGGLLAFTFTIGDSVKAMFNAVPASNIQDVEE